MFRVKASALNIRRGPGTKYPVAGQLPQGALIEPVDMEGWLPVAADGYVGWVAQQYLEEVPEPPQTTPVQTSYDFSTKEGTIAAIRAECERQGLGLPEQIAYVLATVEWETNGTFQPVREAYWKSEEWRRQNLRYYPYYGRGFVQLTWKANYQKYAAILGVDLVNNPDKALEPETALFILVHGFKTGAFTGKKLEDYINAAGADFVQARRCINALDRAKEIAALAERYLEAEGSGDQVAEITEWPWLKIARQELGVKEVTGSGNNPRVVEYLKSTTLGRPENERDETPWCFTGEVEILTDRGWVRFDELKNERVAQVWPSGKVDLVIPSRVISKQFHGDLITIKNRSFDLTCDPQHHFWGYWNTSKLVRLEKRPIISLTSNLHIPAVESSSLENKTISDMDLRLLAAFLADGCLHRGLISFQVSKPRKIERLQNFDPIYTYEAARSYGSLSMSPLTTVQFHLPPVFDNVFEDYKVLRWDFLWSLSSRQLRLFVEEYAFFDGHQKSDNNSIISTTSKVTADFLCAACALSGLHPRSTNRGKVGLAHKDVLNISFSTKKRTATIRPTDLQRHYGKADLYCVEVPSGLILVRDRNGNPLVTGNCSAFVNWVLQKAGVEPRTNSAWARSWLNWGVPTDEPIPGTIVVLSRGTNAGHVGFYLDEDASRIQVLGGNQGNAVTIAWFPKTNLLGYREPEGWQSA